MSIASLFFVWLANLAFPSPPRVLHARFAGVFFRVRWKIERLWRVSRFGWKATRRIGKVQQDFIRKKKFNPPSAKPVFPRDQQRSNITTLFYYFQSSTYLACQNIFCIWSRYKTFISYWDHFKCKIFSQIQSVDAYLQCKLKKHLTTLQQILQLRLIYERPFRHKLRIRNSLVQQEITQNENTIQDLHFNFLLTDARSVSSNQWNNVLLVSTL